MRKTYIVAFENNSVEIRCEEKDLIVSRNGTVTLNNSTAKYVDFTRAVAIVEKLK